MNLSCLQVASGESPNLDWHKLIGPNEAEVRAMLEYLGFGSIDDFVEAVVPEGIRTTRSLELPTPLPEHLALQELVSKAKLNKSAKSLIGLGVHNTVTPAVIQRHILENPAWYTPYTPYQGEIAQGRLEALMNFQTMVAELTCMDVANASMLDESTAAAEAMMMCRGINTDRNRFIASPNCHPHILQVLATHARGLGIELQFVDLVRGGRVPEDCCGVLVQYPDTFGAIYDLSDLVTRTHEVGALVVVLIDPLALVLITPPGEFGADIVVGSTQRFGIPPGFGGPQPGFLATKKEFLRQMPGRIVGLSKDKFGNPAYRLALQTREQHIRREKATSNICTAESLVAIAASMYAIFYGPDGLRWIAQRIHQQALRLALELTKMGFRIHNAWVGSTKVESPLLPFFDTVICLVPSGSAFNTLKIGWSKGINLRFVAQDAVGISLDETVTEEDLEKVLEIFMTLKKVVGERSNGGSVNYTPAFHNVASSESPFRRRTPPLKHEIFQRYKGETLIVRYIHSLASKDIGLQHGMIPLGSCTMKLNPTAAVLPFTWREFRDIHPFAPPNQTEGWSAIFTDLEKWLAEITGMDRVCFSPLSGAHGEYTGLMVIKAYHQANGQGHRRICVIPESAHGTNPASAAKAGFQVVSIKCDACGNIDLDELRAIITGCRDNLAAIMLTYPSTYGIFDPAIKEISEMVHRSGGLVYFDGANLNALLGISRPGDLGADVCHLNVHKTFGTPHGGGGPGAGPVCVKEFLAKYLPCHLLDPQVNQPIYPDCTRTNGFEMTGPVSGYPMGNALVYIMVWVYLRIFGNQIAQIGPIAILNANYLARKLSKFFSISFTGQSGFVAHECIIDLRKSPVTVEDVAKRMIDYGYHAPTIAWPVTGGMMIEPTESEPKSELDRFCAVMESIYNEIRKIQLGEFHNTDNPLKNAPHAWFELISDGWFHSYSRRVAACLDFFKDRPKYFPPVARIDNVWGDRNPILSRASGQ